MTSLCTEKARPRARPHRFPPARSAHARDPQGSWPKRCSLTPGTPGTNSPHRLFMATSSHLPPPAAYDTFPLCGFAHDPEYSCGAAPRDHNQPLEQPAAQNDDSSAAAEPLTDAPESAFRAPCPSVTSWRGHSPCRWPASRRVTATAPAKSHAHDPVAGARKGTPMTVLAIGDARCSWPASRNTIPTP